MTAENKNYQVLALKYRSQSFKDLMGQSVLVKTLQNAIEQDRIAHAYMFTGIRGTGKTSTARILAKALNCAGVDGKNDKPTIQPCCKCENCLAIENSVHIDVIEMDAASHTGVDDVRRIIEEAQYKPSVARYKVYIIDEVHMLSKSAFNALLKTLEEPPAFVKFIFATTEIRKVPITILSRCQKFNLARVSIDELKKHYGNILKSEKVEFEDEVLNIVARVSSGSVRDGLSVLDQAISNADGKITVEKIKDVLGISDRGDIVEIFSNVINSKIEEALKTLNNLYSDGADPVLILTDLMDLVHNVLKVKVIPGYAEKLPFSKEEQKEIIDFSKKISPSALINMWQLLTKGYDEIRNTDRVLQTIEMILMKVSYVSSLPPIEKIMENGVQMNTADSSSDQVKKNEIISDSAGKLTVIAENPIRELIKIMKDKKEFLLSNEISENLFLESQIKEGNSLKLKLGKKKDINKETVKKIKAFIENENLDVIIEISENQTGVSIKEEDKKIEKETISDLKKSDEKINDMLSAFKDAKVDVE